MTDRRSAAGLDWLNFFTANLQTAFGPFVSVYLTQRAWTQGDIGLVLGVGYAASMAAQVPAGALVDAMRRKTTAAGLAILAIIAGALTLAFLPTLLPVMLAEISHAFASCMLGPAIAAISLGLAGQASNAVGERLGRNARFASIGNGTAAGLMAVIGTSFGARAVFLLGAALAVPGLWALRLITAPDLPAGHRALPVADHTQPRPDGLPTGGHLLTTDGISAAGYPAAAVPASPGSTSSPMIAAPISARSRADSAPDPGHSPAARASTLTGLAGLLADRRLVWFAACCAAFHLANAAMLPLAAGAATTSLGRRASLVIGACIVGPQIVVAALSPFVGRAAERWGRRPVLAAGMLALPARGLALALIALNPAIPAWELIGVQLLDGVSGAAFGVLLPLVAADIAAPAGRFNLCMGVLGLAIGAAAASSTLIGGRIADGSLPLAFLCLAGVGAVGVALAWLMPETRGG